MKAAAKDEKSGTSWRRISAILLFAGVLMAALAFANNGRAAIETPPPPSVWSDKADYAPGEQVTLSGANWAPGESVHIRVNDDAGATWRRDVDVTAADDGSISDQFNLPDWFVAVYTVTATGASSGTVTWTFTDASLNTASLSIRESDCTTVSSSFITGDTVCVHSSVTTQGGGTNPDYFVQWFDPSSTLVFTDSHPSVANNQQLDDSHVVSSAGTWTVKACANTGCNGGNLKDTRTFTVVADTTPPDTTITAQPSNPTSSSSASFSFTGTDNVTSVSSLTFECKLDAGAFSSCTSPKSYSGLAEGPHTFQVRATDAAGNTDASPASYTWFVDTTAPNTSIDTSPSDPSSDTSPSLGFSGTDNHSAAGALTFECQLDSGGWASCTSPESVAVTEGSHTFEARATDQAGNTDASPASYSWFVDTTPPDASIDSSPSNPTNSTAAAFSLSAADNHSAPGDIDFECQLDGGGLAPCTSPKTYSGLSEGSHTFDVKATDEAGNDDTASYTWFVDTTAPETSIDSNPSDPTNSTSASFGFSGTDSHSATGDLTFECELDGGGFGSCSSPKSYSALAEGSHTFKVRATDEAGNSDATPESHTWFVDLTAPETSIDTNPSDPSSDTSPSLGFSGTDNHSAAGALTFECQLDSSGWASCTSPESVAVTEGSHTFEARATDEAGNTDATPASYTWFVDTTAPNTSIDTSPSDPSSDTSPSFTFSGTDNHSAAGDLTFECELDGAGFSSCSSPKSYSGLAEGSHTLKVRATDEAGNTDATPDSFTWTVDTTGPSITLTTPPNGATYTQGQVVNASYSCSDSSGVATCIGTVANLAQINTATVGSKSFTVNATDTLGNASSLTHNYSVVYNFSGFFSPVDNPPICNVVKAGQAVPIKFSLHGNQGMNIFAAGSPSSQPGTCSGLASDPLEETATAGQSTLNYDAQADQYVYVWKTEKSWAGTARLLTVTLADGTKHLARFTFTK